MNADNHRITRAPNPFRQTNAFAMNYALAFGLYWIVGFVCFVQSPTHQFLSLLFYFIFASAPVAGYFHLKRFRDRVCGGQIAFGRAYLFTILLYFYAALLLAAACYVYFAFIDHGAFFDSYIQLLSSPEAQQMVSANGGKLPAAGISLNELKSAFEQIQALSPVVYAAHILDLNIFIALILALPTALFASSAKRWGADNK